MCHHTSFPVLCCAGEGTWGFVLNKYPTMQGRTLSLSLGIVSSSPGCKINHSAEAPTEQTENPLPHTPQAQKDLQVCY